MRLLVFVVVLVTAAITAQATEYKPAVCNILVDYIPTAGVVYEPGVDVNGNMVTPADTAILPFEVPDIVSVPLTVDLAEKIQDNPDDFKGIELQEEMGTIDIHMDGRVTYNGQDWTPHMQTLCSQTYEFTEDGQAADNDIKSETKAGTVQAVQPVKKVEKPPEPPVQKPEEEPVKQQQEESPGKLLQGGESREEGYR